MKNVLIGLLLALLMFEGYHAFKWKQLADIRGWQAEQVYHYLSDPIAKSADGHPISRSDVLDVMVGSQFQKK